MRSTRRRSKPCEISSFLRHLLFVIPSAFDFRHSSFSSWLLTVVPLSMNDIPSEHEPIPQDQPFTIEVAERVRRLPPYLFAEINKLMYEKRRAGADVIDLGMGNPSDPPQDLVIEKLAEAARDPKNHGYVPAQGILSLRREAAAKYLQELRRAARSAAGGDRLPRVEGGVQPHVPGAGGAGRHGHRAGPVLSGPSVCRGHGRRQRHLVGSFRQREAAGEHRLHLPALGAAAEAADRQLPAQSHRRPSSSRSSTSRWSSWPSDTGSWSSATWPTPT